MQSQEIENCSWEFTLRTSSYGCANCTKVNIVNTSKVGQETSSRRKIAGLTKGPSMLPGMKCETAEEEDAICTNNKCKTLKPPTVVQSVRLHFLRHDGYSFVAVHHNGGVSETHVRYCFQYQVTWRCIWELTQVKTDEALLSVIPGMRTTLWLNSPVCRLFIVCLYYIVVLSLSRRLSIFAWSLFFEQNFSPEAIVTFFF